LNKPITGIGVMEALVMASVWKHAEKQESVTVPEVFKDTHEAHRRAYTSIMTVMTRLAKKGLLEVDKSYIPYRYKPTMSKEEFRTTLHEDVDKILGE